MDYDYYVRFQRAIARSLQWGIFGGDKVHLYTDFLQKQDNVFLAPLTESINVLERRLIEFFSINMVAQQRGKILEACDYEELRQDARAISLPEIFQAMQNYPLTVAMMLYYLFQEQGKESPVLITIGNVLRENGEPYAPAWNNYLLRQFADTPVEERGQRLSAWLTFRDGTLLNPTLKLTNSDASECSLLYLTTMEKKERFLFDPILVGENLLMEKFGHC
ncbi:hypothetical protein [Entomospira culicis]|uniref:Uncharacterized protein n=1 Tax=Entomospira culicis TaxID=2719989 RepID=A0A968KUI0_9SPIO|nr:hypothetical protein [Entomospira culicis]NIZ19506.1 hypothetical protein [Entomospira culicis]NIZ69589.1 hypothetical protein [Entomospira culicis]WDI36700.1 hypothetical protein PVA46_05080 [Entomospira culicis]WDI38329.1 hypothetical protein PVA47_05090 [Entomospira culicis]